MVRDIAPGSTAALAVDLETGKVVYRENSERALLPASAEKLAVSLTALRLLGPGFRFRTEVVGSGSLDGKVWDGDLALVGFGDPTLEPEDIAALAHEIAGWGIKRVTGRVVGDEHYFDARRAAPGWKPSYVGIESRPLSALSVAATPFQGVNGSAAAAALALTESLERGGIAVEGSPAAGRATGDGLALAEDVSEPLAEIVRHMNRESDNFVAEMLLKELGASIAGHGSTTAGASVVRSELAEAGVPLAGVRIADGSGLSLRDRLTADALVAILRQGTADPTIRDAFVTSLSVAGISGTLEHRLDRRPTRGQVIAKTGTTNAASALAGFVRRRYVFAVLQNGSPVPYWSARAAQDRFVTVLARS
jgi:D-alanyl-D-alanine carboxypeptidase/D-alanyl-D-alanine-endopeptidase (penicillin-binding protein 4)